MSDKPRFTIRYDWFSYPYAIDKDGVTVININPTERTAENVNEIVRLLNVADEVENRKENKCMTREQAAQWVLNGGNKIEVHNRVITHSHTEKGCRVTNTVI